jgi:hypothetical protein
MDKKIDEPSPGLVQNYIDKFNFDRELDAVERALSEIFSLYPNNENLHGILIKVAGLNSLYSTNIYAVIKVALHILDLDIDAKLHQGDLRLIDDVAWLTIGNKRRRNYSFASKYCHWHQPQLYPIYDSYVERLLWEYHKIYGFMEFKRTELQQYSCYKEAIEAFRKFFNLEKFGFKELDKFLWLYGRRLYARYL